MSDSHKEPSHNLVVLIWTPIGRDAQLIQETLQRSDIAARCCAHVEDVCEAIREDEAGLVILAEEASSQESVLRLRETLQQQPPWSDLPLLLLTGGGQSTEASLSKLNQMSVLGNITLLERPLRRVTLLSAVRSALASRARQWQTRTYIEELQATQRQLVQANEDLKQFTFASSHDLQEPLRMVSIFTQLLIDRYVDPSQDGARQYAGYIKKGVARIEDLLRDLLHYSRAVHEDRSDKMVFFDLTTAYSEACHALYMEIQAKGAQITSDPFPTVIGDPTQLSLVFQNLLSNSLKYAQENVVPQIQISVDKREQEYRIQVRDNGIGFDQKYAERIFNLFQRLEDTQAPGTGLGLAICRRIIERHGGQIWAESERGVGSAFYFTLPILTQPTNDSSFCRLEHN